MSGIILDGLYQVEGINDKMADVKAKIEERINLTTYTNNIRSVVLPMTTVMRTCALVGLSQAGERKASDIQSLSLSLDRAHYPASMFAKPLVKRAFQTLIKMRYHNSDVDLNSPASIARIITYEMLRGRDILMKEGAIEDWLYYTPKSSGVGGSLDIPRLELVIGKYENGNDAIIDMNSRNISNTQIIIAGATGSGKTNLLALLINQMRKLSSDSMHPVNFLLFDYKGEFSDPNNESWLDLFDTDTSAILDPLAGPLPFSPFKDFSGKPIGEVNMYATTMSNALCSIAQAKISANMDERLSQAIINAYKSNDFKPITFDLILQNYQQLLEDSGKIDSVVSSLNQIVRNHLFSDHDEIDLIKDCYIINLNKFPKEGILAKAIVYFAISKLNNIYETLEKQAVNDECVELRHFTIIDEAHYMLDFENTPLQNLVQVGRNKGMSIILATQDMSDFKTKYFNFFTNAQYPMLMKQQSQNDSIIKDLFGVTGSELNELKSEISRLGKGEVIMKDNQSALLGIGKKYKKIKLNKII